jgi:hypothetical protein
VCFIRKPRDPQTARRQPKFPDRTAGVCKQQKSRSPVQSTKGVDAPCPAFGAQADRIAADSRRFSLASKA